MSRFYIARAFFTLALSFTPILLKAESSSKFYHLENSDLKSLQVYLKNFESLAKDENWKEILEQGMTALEIAKKHGKTKDEAKICAQLTSTSFYLGDYDLALKYANRSHELSEEFTDPSLFIRALYLESAVHRALAGKTNDQNFYELAVKNSEEALHVYANKDLDDQNLKGKVYFNLGAAHADNPKGNLEKAENSYVAALSCFKNAEALDDIIRVSIRLGKVYLLQKKYDLSEKIIQEIRPELTNERISMHMDYLEAQLKVALHDFPNALKIAETGLFRAKTLGAKEDEARLLSLIESIKK